MTERQSERHRPPEGTIPMVGRRCEVDALASAMYQHVSRLIIGPNGIGKIRLAHEALALARQSSVLLDQTGVLHKLPEEFGNHLIPGASFKVTATTRAVTQARVQQCAAWPASRNTRMQSHIMILPLRIEALMELAQ